MLVTLTVMSDEDVNGWPLSLRKLGRNVGEVLARTPHDRPVLRAVVVVVVAVAMVMATVVVIIVVVALGWWWRWGWSTKKG